jgi:hypothetical protein
MKIIELGLSEPGFMGLIGFWDVVGTGIFGIAC